MRLLACVEYMNSHIHTPCSMITSSDTAENMQVVLLFYRMSSIILEFSPILHPCRCLSYNTLPSYDALLSGGISKAASLTRTWIVVSNTCNMIHKYKHRSDCVFTYA